MKKIKFLSKRSRKELKAKKSFLISKIEQCKKLSELEGWSKTMDYYPVLSKDNDWDYGFLLDLIRFKLKRMSNYFHTHNIIENEDRLGVLCDKAIALLDIAYGEDITTEDVYVNTKNAKRFIPKEELEVLEKNLKTYYLPILRCHKAKKLFWEFMHNYIEHLWD